MLRWLQKSHNYKVTIARRAFVYACAMHCVMLAILLLLPVCSTHSPSVIPVRIPNKDVIFKIVPFKSSRKVQHSVSRRTSVRRTPVRKTIMPKKTVCAQKSKAVPKKTAPKKIVSKKQVTQKKKLPIKTTAKPTAKKIAPKKQLPKNPVQKNPAPKNPAPKNPVQKNPAPKNPVPKNPVPKKLAEKKEDPSIKEKNKTEAFVPENIEVIEVSRKEYETLQIQKDIGEQVANYWSIPPGLTGRRECLVRVSLARDGSVRTASFEKKSGVLAYDLAARAAALRVQYPRDVWGKSFVLDFGSKGNM